LAAAPAFLRTELTEISHSIPSILVLVVLGEGFNFSLGINVAFIQFLRIH
jgi:hypothetical protein